jgi:5-methylcytosine-specific restriction endonuclease McrA
MLKSILLSLPDRQLLVTHLVGRLYGISFRDIKLKFLWEHYGKHCFYCKREITLNQSSRDHAQPKSRGGGDNLENLRLCCKECNSLKQDMTEKEYMSYLSKNLRGRNFRMEVKTNKKRY